jgi:hypothetical protein
MTRNMLLAASAIVALTAGSAFGAGQHPGAVMSGPKINGVVKPLHSPGPLGGPGALLYSQNNGGTGSYISSQNFTSGTFATFNDAAADDFVMPSGAITGGVTEVDVTGLYSTGGPATSEVVSFYTNKAASKKVPYSHPGKLKYTFTVKCVSAPAAGDFECGLPYTTKTKKGKTTYKAAAKLAAGDTYWVSVVTNQNFANTGQWYWGMRSPIVNDQGVWENPGLGWNVYYGYDCPTWEPDNCYPANASDLMFALYG